MESSDSQIYDANENLNNNRKCIILLSLQALKFRSIYLSRRFIDLDIFEKNHCKCKCATL